MKTSDKYLKIVEWSEEDQCYVGSSSGLLYGGCHGDNERRVFAELCQIAEETIALHRKDNKPLPPPTSGRDLVNRIHASHNPPLNPAPWRNGLAACRCADARGRRGAPIG